MKPNAILLLAVVLSLGLVVATGAATFSSSGTDEIPKADLALEPSDGPNGKFALLNEDEEIELVLTEANPNTEHGGVHEDTLTTLDDVFTINYTGEGHADVWITDSIDDVRFYHGETSENRIDRQNRSVVLGPNESVAIGLRVDTRGEHDVESLEAFTINAHYTDENSPGSPTPGAPGGDGDDERDRSTESSEPSLTPSPTPTSETTVDTGPSVDGEPEAGGGGPPPNATDSSDTPLGTEQPMDGGKRSGSIDVGVLGALALALASLLALLGWRRLID